MNRVDPSGHLSWQAWLGIGLGIAGLALTVVTAGASIAAAGGLAAALSAASTTTLVVGAVAVVSDVTAIVSGALEEASPTASSALGWVSLGTGFAGLGAGLGTRLAKSFSRLATRTPTLAQDVRWAASDELRVSIPWMPGLRYVRNRSLLNYSLTRFISLAGKNGELIVTKYKIAQKTFVPKLLSALRNKQRVTILSGVDGAPDGSITRKFKHFTEDEDLIKKLLDDPEFQHIDPSTVNVVDMWGLEPIALKEILETNGVVIVASCFSRNNSSIIEIMKWKPTTMYG